MGVRHVLVLCAAAACSSSSSTPASSSGTTPPPGGDDGGGSDSGAQDAGGDAAPKAPVNGCKTFVDRSAASDPRTINWTFPLSSDDRCIAITAGQTVTFKAPSGAPFAQYSITPAGGDSPNPIANVDQTTGQVAFPKKGTFGYASPDAPALTGAIDVR